MDISVQKIDKICRVCLIQGVDMLSLFSKLEGDDRSLLEILAFTADININLEDNLPKQVCGDCQTVMCKADAFKRRSKESETILLSLFHKDESDNKTSNDIIRSTTIHEDDDTKQNLTNYDSNTPSNSFYCDSLDSLDKKDDLLLQNTVSMSAISNNLTEVPDTTKKLVKEEELNYFDDEIDFSEPFLNIDQNETTPLVIKQEETDKNELKNHKCFCGKLFSTKECYKSHLKQENCKKNNKAIEKNKKNKSKIECDGCGRKFNTSHTWKTHKCTQQNNLEHSKTCTCKQCINIDELESKQSTDSDKLTDKIKAFQCSMCLRKFKKKSTLSAHVERHKEKDCIKHICGVCKREFKYKAYLENHILTVHSRKNGINCDTCGLSFPDKKHLELHKENHKNEKKHQCNVCSKSFLMLCTLKEHMRTHTGEKPYLCSQCGRGFSQKTNLAQHMRRHQGLKPFKCDSCEKRFVSKGELDAHNRKHSGAHPFVCDDCGNGFTTSSALVKHRRIHTGEKPYQCDLCPMRFAASGTLKNHRRIHTGERPFQCSYCEKAFVQRNDLISHIRCHTGEKPYICNQCGQSFRKAAGLKSHVKMHLKEPVHMLPGVVALINGLQCSEQ